MNLQPIFSYQNPRQFLLDYLNSRQRENVQFSLRRWSKEIGFKSHALLLMLLQGKRPLRLKHIPQIARSMGLSSAEQLYFQALVQFDSAQTEEERKLCRLWLSELNPGSSTKTKVVHDFEVISNWLYTAILAMTDLKSFRGGEQEIHSRLGQKATIFEVRAALQRLLDLGYIVQDKCGNLTASHERTTSRDDVPDEGVKKYHLSTTELARQAIRQTPLECREFQSFSIAIDKDKMPLAKEMIRKFRAQFAKAMSENIGTEVYQMNIQLFQLTESPAVPAEDEGVDTGCPNP